MLTHLGITARTHSAPRNYLKSNNDFALDRCKLEESAFPRVGIRRRRIARLAVEREEERAAPAGRAVDRAQGGAALVRASQWIKRRNAPLPPSVSAVASGLLAKTPYLAALARRRRPHHRIRRRGGRTSPQPEFKKWRRRPAGGPSRSRCRPRSCRRGRNKTGASASAR